MAAIHWGDNGAIQVFGIDSVSGLPVANRSVNGATEIQGGQFNSVKFSDVTYEYFVDILSGKSASQAFCRVQRRTISTGYYTWASSAVAGDGSYGAFQFIATNAAVCAALTYNYGVAA